MASLGAALLTPEPPPGLWLLCGPPASGKSTFRRHWWQGPVVSPDDLRLAMLGTAFDPRREGTVWARVRREVAQRLAAAAAGAGGAGGPGVLLDATFVRAADRRPWIAAARKAGLPAYAIGCWDPARTPVEELLRRNAQRPDPVPEDRVRAMAAAWQPPSPAEGLAATWTALAW